MSRFLSGVVLGISVFAASMDGLTQTVGIGVDVPAATLDIQTTAAISSIRVERLLASSALFNPTVVITDESDYGVLEVYQQSTVNTETLAYFQHDGTGTGIWSAVSNAANPNPAAFFTHTGTGPGAVVYQAGSGEGMEVLLDGFLNLSDGVRLTHLGNGTGLFIDAYNLTDNVLNFVESGIGVYNLHFADNAASMIVDKGGFLGTGFNGDGYYFTNTDLGTPASGADGYAFRGVVNTRTAHNPVTGEVFGSVFSGRQYGPGFGLLLNHSGTTGYGAYISMNDGANADPAMVVLHQGPGTALVAQNADNTIAGITAVAEVAYVGADVDDHVGLAALSRPAADWGIGVYAFGGYVGVYGEAGDAASLAAVYAEGDLAATGAKPFIIDHPEKPETHILKHFAVESDKVLNMYQGNVRLGRSGRAVVEMPSYFDDINTEFSYQLTPVGSAFQPWVAARISGNRFEIGGKPGGEVSWVVYARRNDAYARANAARLVAEQAKRPQDKGRYLDPASHGMPAESGIFHRPAPVRIIGAKPSAPLPVTDKRIQKKAAERLNGVPASLPGGRSAVRPETAPVLPRERMEIRRDIGTWDELR